MIDRRERIYQAFGAFLEDFIRDLNNSSEEGWSLLVEGLRDERAVRRLGYHGPLLTTSMVSRSLKGEIGETKVIILTDLDREGDTLASRYTKELAHAGVLTSLAERRRLKGASRGFFLHIENLSRFARTEEDGEGAPPLGAITRVRGEGLRSFRRKDSPV